MYVVTQGGGGFYKSTDGDLGAEQLRLNCRFVNNLREITGAGANRGHLYATTACASNSGIYKSIDQGATWNRVGFPNIPNNADVGLISQYASSCALPLPLAFT